MKALSLDQVADGRPDDLEPLVLRAIEVDGELTIVPVPEDRDLDREQLEQLARWRANRPTQGPRTEGAPSRGGREDRRDASRPEGGKREADRGGRGAGRYRTLHYASAMEREPVDGQEEPSTPEIGGSK